MTMVSYRFFSCFCPAFIPIPPAGERSGGPIPWGSSRCVRFELSAAQQGIRRILPDPQCLTDFLYREDIRILLQHTCHPPVHRFLGSPSSTVRDKYTSRDILRTRNTPTFCPGGAMGPNGQKLSYFCCISGERAGTGKRKNASEICDSKEFWG